MIGLLYLRRKHRFIDDGALQRRVRSDLVFDGMGSLGHNRLLMTGLMLLMMMILLLVLLLWLLLALLIACHRRWCSPVVVVVLLFQFCVRDREPAERVSSQILTELPALCTVADQSDSISFQETQLILAGRQIGVETARNGALIPFGS